MKKVLLIGALVLTSSFAFSQTNKDGKAQRSEKENIENREERMKAMKDKMAKELGLTDAQVKQINSIDDKYRTREDALRQQSESLRDQRHKLREEKKAEIDKVFTAEQKEKLNDMRGKFHDKRRHGDMQKKDK